VDLAVLRRIFDDHRVVRPVPHGARAAVAAVFREGERGSELLFIERARREGDPWSGHMALPGGRVDPGDEHALATAERETREELSLDLAPAERLGRLDDLLGGARPITVSAFGFWLPGERPALAPNHEVADALWIPLTDLADPRRAVAYRYPLRDREVFPGIAVDEQRVVWGMTLRLLQDLFTRLGNPLRFPV
jgi:8-oxo-dGTP pyrophosphatase MutT (NUDIX family)